MTMSSDVSNASGFLICRCGSQLCAFSLEHVIESMRPLPVSAIPDMPPFLLGVAIIRGALTPVVQLSQLIGAKASMLSTRFVTMATGTRITAFAVDSVIGVHLLDLALVLPITILSTQVESSNIAAITLLDSELLLVLQNSRIINDEVWNALTCQDQQV